MLFYKFLIMSEFHKKHSDRPDTIWRELLGLSNDTPVNFSFCYTSPIPKIEGDLQWRILHGAYATGNYLFQSHFSQTPNCIFCGNRDDLFHIFLECHRLNPLFKLLRKLSRQLLGPNCRILYWWFVLGPPFLRTVMDKNIHALLNFIFNTAKLVIHTTRRKAITENDPHLSGDLITAFKSRIRTRILNEYAYHGFSRQNTDFNELWCVNNVLASVSEGKLNIADILS